MSDYFERIERQLVERVMAPSRRSQRSRRSRRSRCSRLIGLASGWLVPAVAVLVAVAVVAAFFAVGAPRGTRLSPGNGGTELTYVARATNSSVPLKASVGLAVARLRDRLAAVRPAVTVVRHGGQVTLRGVTPATRSTVQALARPGHLVFYDWEANALTPSGNTAASQLTAQEPAAVTVSQGAAGGSGPGAGGGGLSLYRAVRLASRQPVVTAGGNARLSRAGPVYYLFGAPGSPACAAVAGLNGSVAPGEHCLLAGPDAGARTVRSDLPAGVSASDAEQLVVPQGTVVLQASGATAGQSLAPSRPTAQFYVLRDHGALSGAAITRPAQSTDQSGQPDVSFGFTASGQTQFERATAAIAHRASVASLSGTAGQQNQHFAIALDQQLLSVPSIDFRTYPEGIPGRGGADIAGGFTRHAARELAAILRTGPLPVDLILLGQR